jgi:hypothetical protein
LKKGKTQKKQKNFWIKRKSDGVSVYGPIRRFSPGQALGFYVTKVLEEAWRKKEFYASDLDPEEPVVKPQNPKPKAPKRPGACPKCGYFDHGTRQGCVCPNCT